MRKNNVRTRRLKSSSLGASVIAQQPPASPRSKIRLIRSVFVVAARTITPYGRFASLSSALISAALLLTPKITINSAAIAPSNDPFATYFLVKNEGFVPIFSAEFGCKINSTGNMNLENLNILQKRAVNLWPGQTITRNCSVVSQNTAVQVELDAYVIYEYIPFIEWKKSAHFSGRRSGNGYYLVPDLP